MDSPRASTSQLTFSPVASRSSGRSRPLIQYFLPPVKGRLAHDRQRQVGEVGRQGEERDGGGFATARDHEHAVVGTVRDVHRERLGRAGRGSGTGGAGYGEVTRERVARAGQRERGDLRLAVAARADLELERRELGIEVELHRVLRVRGRSRREHEGVVHVGYPLAAVVLLHLLRGRDRRRHRGLGELRGVRRVARIELIGAFLAPLQGIHVHRLQRGLAANAVRSHREDLVVAPLFAGRHVHGLVAQNRHQGTGSAGLPLAAVSGTGGVRLGGSRELDVGLLAAVLLAPRQHPAGKGQQARSLHHTFQCHLSYSHLKLKFSVSMSISSTSWLIV